jgi:dTDP-4-dehydrorhamnose 3,5-epimerase
VVEGFADHERFMLYPTPVKGVMEVEFRPIDDERGSFARVFEAAHFERAGLFPDGPVHINLAKTREAGTVRGLHWQDPAPGVVGETKLITCVAGKVFDVAVDVRQDSPTRFQHHAVELSATDNRALLIPPGVAHGMQALEDFSTLLYLHAAPFVAELERGVRVDDPALSIPWPLPVRNLSARDQSHPSIAEGER